MDRDGGIEHGGTCSEYGSVNPSALLPSFRKQKERPVHKMKMLGNFSILWTLTDQLSFTRPTGTSTFVKRGLSRLTMTGRKNVVKNILFRTIAKVEFFITNSGEWIGRGFFRNISNWHISDVSTGRWIDFVIHHLTVLYFPFFIMLPGATKKWFIYSPRTSKHGRDMTSSTHDSQRTIWYNT